MGAIARMRQGMAANSSFPSRCPRPCRHYSVCTVLLITVTIVARSRCVSLALALLIVLGLGFRLASPAAATKTFTFRGRGWGHAVGMSQWGARGLAERGWLADRILTHYYRGTSRAQVSTPRGIRVGLLQEQTEIAVTGNGRFDLYDRTGARRASGVSGEMWRIKLASGQISVTRPNGAVAFMSGSPVTVRYEANGTLITMPKTGHSYKHGRVDVDINSSTAKLRAILIVPFEQYLYGLGEMPSSWPTESLKAQAIAGRTYALEKVQRLGQNRPVCNCAVYASTADQAYVGSKQEVSRWVGAVDATKGRVVTYADRPIQAVYSSASGGYTENNEYVWGGGALSYLRGVCDPGDYASGANPHNNWTYTIAGDVFGRRLAAYGYNVGAVERVSYPSPRGVSGRLRAVIDSTHGGVTITGSKGTARVSGSSFRSILGMKSTLVLHHISGDIRNRYDALSCKPGLPTAGEGTWRNLDGTSHGRAQNFTGGRLFLNTDTHKVFWTKGPILARYDALRKKGIDLGLATTDEHAVPDGRRSNFEHGYITWNPQTGTTTFVVRP